MADTTQAVFREKIHLLHFLVRDVSLCAYLNDIKKILPLVALDPLPKGPPWLAGLMKLNEKMIPVIDLAIRTGMPRDELFSLDMPVLLCEKAPHEVAILVDSVQGISDFDETGLQLQDDMKGSGSPFLGTVVNDFGSSLLVNMPYFLATQLMGDDNGYAHQNEK
ncbi:MAG TPA: chemotaxis protein CheW [Gammaproteobacteria bacterium]|nr:chemotaxis protein CheW [Gammaproteobacteria bacterium]